MKPIFSIPLRKKRDLFLAQLRTRQLCRLMGFTPLEQARAVCLVFELACGKISPRHAVRLSFEVRDRALQVFCISEPSARKNGFPRELPSKPVLSFPLPEAILAVEDVFWAMQQIQFLTKPDVLGEIRQQNRDLLRILLELQQGTSSPSLSLLEPEAA